MPTNNPSNPMTDLKPCPFCGKQPELVTCPMRSDGVQCRTPRCAAWVRMPWPPTVEEWNRRPAHPDRELVEALKEMRAAYESASGGATGKCSSLMEERQDAIRRNHEGDRQEAADKYYFVKETADEFRKMEAALSRAEAMTKESQVGDDTRRAGLEKWSDAAFHVIAEGVRLMPLELLSQWTGVRAVQEAFPAAMAAQISTDGEKKIL